MFFLSDLHFFSRMAKIMYILFSRKDPDVVCVGGRLLPK